jgi:hypothetical protein
MFNSQHHKKKKPKTKNQTTRVTTATIKEK